MFVLGLDTCVGYYVRYRHFVPLAELRHLAEDELFTTDVTETSYYIISLNGVGLEFRNHLPLDSLERR